MKIKDLQYFLADTAVITEHNLIRLDSSTNEPFKEVISNIQNIIQTNNSSDIQKTEKIINLLEEHKLICPYRFCKYRLSETEIK